VDTALNVTRANSVLIYDDQASTTTFTGFTSTPGVRDTVNGYLDVADGYVYWGQKLPNAWVMDFEMDIRSGTNPGPLYANVFSTTNTGGDGYSFTFNDNNDKISLYYDGTLLTEATVTGLFTATENWQKVVINYERGMIAISLGGSRKFYYKDIEREKPYVNGEYTNFSSASTDGRKIRNLRIVNGEKWMYTGESNIAYTQGSVGIGVSDPQYTLDVGGDINLSGSFYQGGSPFVSSLWTDGGDSLYYRSNVEVGTGNLYVDTTTGNIGLGTDAPLSTLDVRGDYTMGGHIVPSSDSSYDIGSPEFKIRDLFVSNNSMWVGDRTKIAFENGKMKFKRRKIDKVPKVVRELAIAEVADITDEASVETAAVAYAQQRFPNDGITALADLQLQHWKAYTKSIDDTKEISDIFVDDDEDYEAQSAADAWNEIGSNIYSTHRTTIGANTEPRVTLDINATDALIVPSGTTDERPSTAVPGMFRYNSTTDYFEMYTTGGWASIATPPSIVSFSPNPIAYANVTTEDITVTGSFFDAQSSVQLEGADETLYDTTNFTFVDNATIKFTIGTLVSGQLANRPYKIAVTNGAGLTTKSTQTLGFGNPSIVSFSPNPIAYANVTTEDITVTGSFFDAQSVVQLEGANGTLYNTSNFTFVDSTTIRFRTGNSVSAANSPYTIVVTTGLGLSTSSTDTLTVTPPKLTYNGTEYYTGDTFTLTYSRDEHVMTYTQGLKVQFRLYGGAGGKGMWSNNNDDGAPGGYVRANIQFNTDGTFYAYVGQGNVSASGRAGCGGGSTDIRTQKASDASGSVLNSSFITSFYSGMSSALLVAGGGGGAHGGSYGGWGDTNSPGSGGPTTADTNSRGTNDEGYTATGASTTGPGLDGGRSISTTYTCDGVFGGAGTTPNAPIARTDWAVASGTSHTGYAWPNGGSGTSWANGGGGGGYYGGATNWPNGGGGSNFVKSSTNDFTITNLTNSVHNLIEGGKLVITIL
jgi:hypothetical protein